MLLLLLVLSPVFAWEPPTLGACKWTINSKPLANALNWFKCGGVAIQSNAGLRVHSFQVHADSHTVPWRVSIEFEDTGQVRLDYWPDEPDVKFKEDRFSVSTHDWERAPCQLPKQIEFEDVRIKVYHYDGRTYECGLS